MIFGLDYALLLQGKCWLLGGIDLTFKRNIANVPGILEENQKKHLFYFFKDYIFRGFSLIQLKNGGKWLNVMQGHIGTKSNMFNLELKTEIFIIHSTPVIKYPGIAHTRILSM